MVAHISHSHGATTPNVYLTKQVFVCLKCINTRIFYYFFHTKNMNIPTFCRLHTIKKATLDGVLFLTGASQMKFRAANACVSEDYKES